ncbi:DegT/DnrJ/EryC1/StrS aminotransferase family protein, partial [PVC group bacterium]|nr:DegT/DnrJ/EryC1/StrS aminotransferase family protein [PVC group bacterium]
MIPCFRPTANIKETLAFLLDVVKTPQQSREAVKEFEKQFCIYQNCSHSIFVPSGRMALWLILKAFDYPQGSEIILPAFTFFAIPALIKHLGLIPVYADVDNNTYVLSAKSVQKVISPKTKAVIPTHLFGRTCEMDQLQKICKDNNIDIIEDCAQALGAEIGDTKAGNIGRAAYFTFGITKNFTTFSGGMVICQEETIFKQMQELIAEFHAPQKSALFKQGITALAMRIATSRPVFNISLNPILRLASGEK